MQDSTNAKNPDTHDNDEELVEVLTAISVVSRRLAKKLIQLSGQRQSMEGGTRSEQNERAVPCCCGIA